MPALVTIEAFFAWVGLAADEQSAGDIERAESYISAASARVRSEARQTWLNEAGDALEGVPDDVPGIVLEVVERKWRNPSGVVHETAGPFSARYAEGVANGIYLTEHEIDQLKRYRPSQTSGLHTIRTSRDDALETDLDGYLTVDGSTVPIEAGYLT